MKEFKAHPKPPREGPSKRAEFKRSPMPPRSAPMARTSFATGSGATMARSTLKSSGPKMTPIRASARGEACTLRFAGICNRDPATVVLCHKNGAGMGMKSLDEDGAYGCHACHMVLDGQHKRPEHMTRDWLAAEFARANAETRDILARKVLIEVEASHA